MNDASASDVVVGETPEKPAEAPPPVRASARLQSGTIVGIFALLVFYFLYFASPILIPIITALLLSMQLAPFVRLLEWVRVPRTLGSLIVVVAAVGVLFGIAASLRGPAQSWLTETQRFSRLEEKLRPIMAPLKQLQYATEQVEKARELGATDREIHDTVLIAAAFCMFNRYVDGLATWAPEDRNIYVARAKMRAEEGYANLDFYK